MQPGMTVKEIKAHGHKNAPYRNSDEFTNAYFNSKRGITGTMNNPTQKEVAKPFRMRASRLNTPTGTDSP